MVDVTKPIYGEIWANSGEKLSPGTDKIATGWIQEMMPYQYENFLQNRTDVAISYLLQKGIPEWSAEQEYIANKSVVTYSGQLYLATATSTNVLPTVAASWRRLTLTFGANGAIPVAFGGTGATNATDARTNLGIGSAATVNLPASNGVVVKLADNSLVARTIAGTSGYITVTNGDGVAGNPTINVGANVAKTDQDTAWTTKTSIKIPSGTTAERGTGDLGRIRFNIESGVYEGYDNTGWSPIGSNGTMDVQDFQGDGTTTSFTLSSTPRAENNTQVFFNGVYQQKNSYELVGNSLVFDEAPAADISIEVVTIASVAIGTTTAAQTSIVDGGGYYNSTNVEGALQEVGNKSLHSVLVYQTKDEAEMAASTLQNGQIVDALDVQERYKVQGGVLVFLEFLPWKNMDWVTPELFGAVGGDAEKDTAAFIAMLASGKWQFRPDASKRYKINKNLNFGLMSDWKTQLNIECALSDTGQHDAFITAEGMHSFLSIDVRIPTGIVRRAVISDDFYGGSKTYRKEFRAGYIQIKSEDWQSGYTGDGGSALKLANQDLVIIGTNEIHGFENSANITDSKKVIAGWSDFTKFQRGLQATNILSMEWDGGVFHGDTDDPSGDAGNNAFVCRGVVNGSFGDFFVYDVGEHGVRVTARPDGAGGYYGGRLSFGNISVYRAGKCGVKVHTGTNALERVRDLDIKSLYVEDCGWEIYGPGKIPVEGANHFALNVQTADNIRVGRFVSKKNAGQYCGQNAIMIRDANTVIIDRMDANDSYGNALFMNPGEVVGTDFQIEGKINNCGNGTGVHAAILLATANNLARAMFRVDVFNCPSIYNILTFSGATAGPIVFDGYYDGITGNLYQGVVGRDKIQANMRPFSWPLSGSSEYPLGTTLQALSNSDSVVSVGRNLDVYVSSVSATRFVAVASGKTPVEAVGLKLAGTWASVGRDVSSNSQLVRRIF